MIEKTLGIVLSQIKFGDTSLIVHLYTQRWGRMGILVPGARTSSKGKKAHLFQPLTILELEVYYKAGRDLQKIKEARNHSPFMNLTGDPVKSSVALFLADVLNHALKEETPNSDLFDFLSYHIQYLDIADQGISNFHLFFLLRLSRYFGFNPGLPDKEGAWFDIPAGQYTQHRPVHGISMDPPQAALLAQINSVNIADLGSLQMSRLQRRQLLDSLLSFYHHHLDGLGELRSYPVLQALFD
jgi:DNA repair protein RecO (recombination protein O)